MQQINQQLYDLETESYSIPFHEIKRAIEIMRYGSDIRTMFQMLVYTGCRIKELEYMKYSQLYNNIIYWKLGKNQKKFRKEKLPIEYLKELRFYRKNYRIYQDKLFGIKSCTFRRYFNKQIRQLLKGKWTQKRFFAKQGCLVPEYVFQLKGCRKNYQTLEYAKMLDKWKSPNIAVEMTSKKMKHSSEKITAYHYIENFENLEIDKYKLFTIQDIINPKNQMRILDYI